MYVSHDAVGVRSMRQIYGGEDRMKVSVWSVWAPSEEAASLRLIQLHSYSLWKHQQVHKEEEVIKFHHFLCSTTRRSLFVVFGAGPRGNNK